MEKIVCYRQRRKKDVASDDCTFEDFLSQCDIEKEPNVDIDLLLRGLPACVVSKPRTTNLDQISKTTKDLATRWRSH
ncbi:hypothetical protein RB195_004676 [Necator americanus]|uniref:Uncharacterized protein n=1 Tax=Necator americanus TaxID=51031 RepID=A0ABR1BN28_NECAM